MLSIDNLIILVCQGSEFTTVSNGLKGTILENKIRKIPMGINAVNQFLPSFNVVEKSILVIGLGGSLSPEYQVGDIVIYDSCSYLSQEGKKEIRYCNQELNNKLHQTLNLPLIKGFTSDKLINSSVEKQELRQTIKADVVDMESFAIINKYSSVNVIRVISDNYDDNLPNLNTAITEDGSLDNLKMFKCFIYEPIKAYYLIKNSLISLKVLGKFSQNLGQLEKIF